MSVVSRFIALLSADIVSTLGSQISLVAIPWLVLITTASPTDMGLVAAAEMVPYLLSSTLLTPVADRFGLRTSSVFCDLGSAVAVGCIAAFKHDGLRWLMVLVAVAGGLRGVGDRTKHVLLRPAAQAAGYPMIRVTSLYEGLTRLSTLLGAPLAGLLIVWVGARGAIWLDAASFCFCAVVVASMVAAKPAEPAATRSAPETYRVALAGGFRYLRQDRVLFTMLGIVFTLNVFASAATTVFLPVWAREVLHSPKALGLALGAFAGGALLGTVIFTWLAERLPQYPAFVIGGLISCVPRLLVLGLTDSLLIVLIISIVSGVGISSVNPILGAAMFQRIPDALQTRVIGLCTTVCFTGVPIGALASGWAVTRFGLHNALLGAATLCLAVLAGPLLSQRRFALAVEVTQA